MRSVMPFGREFHPAAASTSATHIKGNAMNKKDVGENNLVENVDGSDAPEGTETQIDLEDGHNGTQSPASDPSPEDRTEFSRWFDSLPPLD